MRGKVLGWTWSLGEGGTGEGSNPPAEWGHIEAWPLGLGPSSWGICPCEGLVGSAAMRKGGEGEVGNQGR